MSSSSESRNSTFTRRAGLLASRCPTRAANASSMSRTFATTVPALLRLADWLEAHEVTGCDGGHRGPLEAGLGDPRRPVLLHADQRPARQATVQRCQRQPSTRAIAARKPW